MQKKLPTKTDLNKFVDASREIVHVVRLLKRDVFVKAMVWNSTTSATTGQAVWITCRLVWLVGTRIVSANPSVRKWIPF